MATENVYPIHSDQLGKSFSFERVGESLGENVSGLVVGPIVADVNPLGSTNFRKPMQVDPVGPSKVG